jgi:hypothetical protein
VFGFGAVIVAAWRVRSGRPDEPVPRPDRGGRHRAVRRPPDAPVQLPDVVGAGDVAAETPASED